MSIICCIQEPGQGGPRARHDSADWSEDDLLAEGFAANLATFRALQQRGRLTLAEVAESLCVSPRTVRRWLKTGKPDPVAGGHSLPAGNPLEGLAATRQTFSPPDSRW